jgi:hypothetical protein
MFAASRTTKLVEKTLCKTQLDGEKANRSDET